MEEHLFTFYGELREQAETEFCGSSRWLRLLFRFSHDYARLVPSENRFLISTKHHNVFIILEIN